MGPAEPVLYFHSVNIRCSSNRAVALFPLHSYIFTLNVCHDLSGFWTWTQVKGSTKCLRWQTVWCSCPDSVRASQNTRLISIPPYFTWSWQWSVTTLSIVVKESTIMFKIPCKLSYKIVIPDILTHIWNQMCHALLLLSSFQLMRIKQHVNQPANVTLVRLDADVNFPFQNHCKQHAVCGWLLATARNISNMFSSF